MRTFVCILLFSLSCSLSEAQNILVHPEQKDEAFILKATNNLPCPVTLTATAEPFDTTFQSYIPKEEKRTLINWSNAPEKLMRQPREILNYNFILGNPDAVHDDSYRYNLPFPEGEAYELTQGNKTDFTHNNRISKYAFDFAMPEGSYVAAARGGVVGYLEDHHKIGGYDANLMEKNNRVLVCHDDGTVAVYAHLQYNGALVEIGDSVFAGQVIGLSGNTGFSTSPHLHFSVLIGDRSIPIWFRDEYTILYEGIVYEH